MDWDARLYDQNHDFVAAYGENLLGLLPDGLGFVVDVGCGTGTLTEALTARAARVVGIDASPDMANGKRRLRTHVRGDIAHRFPAHRNHGNLFNLAPGAVPPCQRVIRA